MTKMKDTLEGRFDDYWETGKERKNVEKNTASIARYVTVITSASTYAIEQGLTLTHKDGENMYEEMCRRQIGNFAFAQRRTFIAAAQAKKDFTLVAHMDADLTLGGYSGNWSIRVETKNQEFIDRLQNAAKHAQKLSRDELSHAVESFREGYLMCYGLCKRD